MSSNNTFLYAEHALSRLRQKIETKAWSSFAVITQKLEGANLPQNRINLAKRCECHRLARTNFSPSFSPDRIFDLLQQYFLEIVVSSFKGTLMFRKIESDAST